MLLGCIADDITGATDLALMLVRGGMRTIQVMGLPDRGIDSQTTAHGSSASIARALAEADAVVIALKSRTAPVDQAISDSMSAADILLSAGARQLFFKYCSTFDSTDEGNIGPVAQALLERSGEEAIAIACPAFPQNGRTVYQGHLFVGAQLLSDSPMRDHPLTPMRDSNLVQVLARQTPLPVGLIPFEQVNRGPDAIGDALGSQRRQGARLAIVDALTEQNLLDIGAATSQMPLVTGGSGIALGIPASFINRGLLTGAPMPTRMAAPAGHRAVLAGSCSAATRGQLEAAIAAGLPALKLEPEAIADGKSKVDDILDWASGKLQTQVPVIYSSADPDEVAHAQQRLGRERAGQLIEQTLADIAAGLVDLGVTRLIVAGGETSGAVVERLGVKAIEIGPEIDPGVPWTRVIDGTPLVLALKSGNFGATDFFTKAWNRLD